MVPSIFSRQIIKGSWHVNSMNSYHPLLIIVDKWTCHLSLSNLHADIHHSRDLPRQTWYFLDVVTFLWIMLYWGIMYLYIVHTPTRPRRATRYVNLTYRDILCFVWLCFVWVSAEEWLLSLTLVVSELIWCYLLDSYLASHGAENVASTSILLSKNMLSLQYALWPLCSGVTNFNCSILAYDMLRYLLKHSVDILVTDDSESMLQLPEYNACG